MTVELPALLLADGVAVTGGADGRIEHLDRRFSERADPDAHRALADQRDGPT